MLNYRRAGVVYVLLASAFGIWLLWDALYVRIITYSIWADYWEHTAALTAWMRDIADPGNPHLAQDSTSARYIPPFLLLTLLGRFGNLDAMDLMALAGVINYGILIVGLHLFCTRYFRNPWAPAVALAVLLGCWGVPWVWSNLYELRSLFLTAGYPSTLVFGLGLISFRVTLDVLRRHTGTLSATGGLLLLSALMFLSHPLTAVFAIGGCCLLALLESDASYGLRLLVAIAAVGGSVLAIAWPWFPVWDAILATSDHVDDRTWQKPAGIDALLERARSGDWRHMFFEPRQFIVALGPALAGIPLCVWLLGRADARRDYAFIPLGALLMALPLCVNVFYQVALAHRFLLYVVFFLHLAIVAAIVRLLEAATIGGPSASERNRARPVLVVGTAALGLLLLGHVALLAGEYRGVHLKYTLEWVDRRAALPGDRTAAELFDELAADLPQDAVVIGPRRLTWPLPTFAGKVVALPDNHENSFVQDHLERVAAVESFMAGDTPDADREAVIGRYGVTHVLVNSRTLEPGLEAWLRERTRPVTTVGWYSLNSLNRPD